MREDPDSPAFYLFAIRWATVREQHGDSTRSSEKSEPRWRKPRRTSIKVAHAASARLAQALAAEDSKLYALGDVAGFTF